MGAQLLRAARAPPETTELPDPVAGPGEILVRVLACGLWLTSS